MREKAALALGLLAICACSSSPAQAPHPAGWTQMPAQAGEQLWGNGAVAPEREQRYRYSSVPYAGDRHDLASREAIRMVLQNPGARFDSSVPFPGCEGLAGLMTFELATGGGLQEAFTVRDGNAITVVYTYPKRATPIPAVTEAMRAGVCALPGT